MKGTIVNTLAVLAGSGIGLVLKRGISERFRQTILQGVALAVLLIGLQMAQKTHNVLIVIVSLVLGAIIGEAADLDGSLNRFGAWMDKRFRGVQGGVSEGFITASLMFCVGAMAIVGAIQDGLTGDASTLYAKSMLDFISAVVFASTFGIGVALSAGSVLVYQGTITILASILSSYASTGLMDEMTAVGGLLIVGLSFTMLEIKKVKVVNLLPAIFIAPFLAYFMEYWHG